MRQVITVSLGNNAYQIDEEGYRALKQYLDRAKAGLRSNPDMEEILGDLERAIGEKCAAALNPTKNVVSSEDTAQILQDMGPVVEEGPEPVQEADYGTDTPRRFRRRRQGAAIAGVCSGLAAYFGIDVLIVRLAFIGLGMSGAGILLYVIMAIVVPGADAEDLPVGRRASRIAKAILVTLLVIVAVAMLAGGRPGLGFAEWLILPMILLVPLALYSLLAIIVGCIAVVVVRHFRSSAR